jgi:substrate import-associated zinc metallohydrolase lipoprotein
VINPSGVSRNAYPGIWKIGPYRTNTSGTGQPNAGSTRPFIILKFSEFYFIAAEAAVKGATGSMSARDLLNVLRARAGKWEYKNNGTYILGTAEGGKKILLSGLNYLPQVLSGGYQGYNDPASALNHFYIKTIHHEFTHILNQTKDFPVEFTQVTPTSYVTESWNTSAYGSFYRQRGFLSTYAQHSDREDFAECLSLYVTNTDETVQGWLEAAGREVTEADVKSDEFKVSFPNLEVGQHFNGDQLILAKLAQVRKYMADTFNIDIDQLRAAVLRRQADVVAGDVDLTSLDVN